MSRPRLNARLALVVVTMCLCGGLVSGAAATDRVAAERARPDADLALFNGQIVTVNGDFEVAGGIAVRAGEVVAVGSTESVRRWVGAGTRTINLHGRMVIPGLIDSHYHQTRAAQSAPLVQLLGARSIADVVAAIGKRAKTTPAGRWVQASGEWHESLLLEGRLPTRHDLDPVSPDNPVFIPRGGHTAAVNTRALREAGITSKTPDPPGGHIVRDAAGRPTGVLFDAAADKVAELLPEPPTGRRLQQLLTDRSAHDLSMGITSVTVPSAVAADVVAYRALASRGALTQRIHLLLEAETLGQVRHLVDTFHRGRLAHTCGWTGWVS